MAEVMPPKEDRKNPPCGQLFYFNYGNEVALAHQRSVSYTPPRIVRQMRRDLAYLPAWIAPNPEQDWVWLPCNAPRFSKEMPFPLAHVFGAEEVELGRTIHHPLHLSLWGPEPTLRPLFSHFRSGFPLLDIPDSYSRPYPPELYDRSLSVELLRELPVPPKIIPRFCYTDEELEEACLALAPGAILAKLPFSSSGRGVLPYVLPLSQESRRSLMAQRQKNGVISLEPLLDKLEDWAAEYQIDEEGRVDFVGLSHFVTERYRYLYNEVCHPRILWQKLASVVGKRLLEEVITIHRDFLQRRVAPHYRGAVGVDMLTYRGLRGEVLLHPAVEVNVRSTMGLLAHRLYECLGMPEARYRYQIASFAKKGDALAWLQASEVETPPRFDGDGKLLSGNLPLHPIDAETQFVATFSLVPS